MQASTSAKQRELVEGRLAHEVALEAAERPDDFAAQPVDHEMGSGGGLDTLVALYALGLVPDEPAFVRHRLGEGATRNGNGSHGEWLPLRTKGERRLAVTDIHVELRPSLGEQRVQIRQHHALDLERARLKARFAQRFQSTPDLGPRRCERDHLCARTVASDHVPVHHDVLECEGHLAFQLEGDGLCEAAPLAKGQEEAASRDPIPRQGSHDVLPRKPVERGEPLQLLGKGGLGVVGRRLVHRQCAQLPDLDPPERLTKLDRLDGMASEIQPEDSTHHHSHERNLTSPLPCG